MTRGLTLGKFAPFHRGHQALFETALSEVEELVAMVYDAAEVTPAPLPMRAGWIRALYPRVRVIEAWDGPLENGTTPEIERRHEDYVRRHVEGITHFYSGEFYGAHMSRALGAADRRIGKSVPVSGTLIRQDPYRYREFLDPVVYRDLIAKIVFLGAPSTGKSTLAARLAEEYGTVWMPEFGREYWNQHQVDRRLTLAQLEEIGEIHLERENALAAQANRYLFCDTNAITTYMFSRYYHGAATPRLEELALRAASRYDLVFLCADDIPYEDHFDRSGGVFRRIFQKMIVADLKLRRLPFRRLRGPLEARLAEVRSVLQGFVPFGV